MPQIPRRPLVLTLALIVLLAFSPTIAIALPKGDAPRPVAGVSPGLFAGFWNFLSALWSDTGPGLDPNGGTTAIGFGAEPDAASTGDNGSILDPNGRP